MKPWLSLFKRLVKLYVGLHVTIGNRTTANNILSYWHSTKVTGLLSYLNKCYFEIFSRISIDFTQTKELYFTLESCTCCFTQTKELYFTLEFCTCCFTQTKELYFTLKFCTCCFTQTKELFFTLKFCTCCCTQTKELYFTLESCTCCFTQTKELYFTSESCTCWHWTRHWSSLDRVPCQHW